MKRTTTNTNTIEVSVRVRPTTNTDRPAIPAAIRAFTYPSNIVVGSSQNQAFETIGRPLLHRMKAGFNTTILAYGQTGSGKTYTMFGPTGSLTEAALDEGKSSGDCPDAWGIFPRIALAMVANATNSGHHLKASAIEIYNNSPVDLLDNRKPLHVSRSKSATAHAVRVTTKQSKIGGGKFSSHKVGVNGEHPGSCTCRDCYKAKNAAKEARRLRVQQARGGRKLPPLTKKNNTKGNKKKKNTGTLASSPKTKFVVNNTTTASSERKSNARTVGEVLWDLKTPQDVAKFSRQIEMSRVAHGHELNERSSRSHCLVRLQYTSTTPAVTAQHGPGPSGARIQQNIFTFVDLAGSERTGKSGVEGQRMSEAITINTSLTVLGRCIRAVGAGNNHVPWRDAVLCQLLSGSFESEETYVWGSRGLFVHSMLLFCILF